MRMRHKRHQENQYAAENDADARCPVACPPSSANAASEKIQNDQAADGSDPGQGHRWKPRNAGR